MPAYSVFIQLQNTTAEMGATAACPGSHYCPASGMEDVCEEGGFQVVGEDGYWKAGDALLMNMNSYHRGAAHIDPNAEDRVMLILTFVPKPQEKAESRQMSQGITFSLRWNMWGHTLDDLANADTRMTQPFATLRALGLYKPKDAHWGIDYVHSASMRMSNEDNGFRRDELDTWIERGGFYYLPDFLEGQVSDDGTWQDYLLDTLERCLEFSFFVSALAAIVYMLIFLLVGVCAPKSVGLRGFGRSIIRLGMMYGAIFGLWRAAIHHVDTSDWAKDIVAGRRWTDAYQTELRNTPQITHLPSTVPHRQDVLIETRYGSPYLRMYNDFVDGHPGSRRFRKLVREGAPTYKAYSSWFRNATADYIVGAFEMDQGRFLYQDVTGDWLWLSKEDALDYTKAELAVESNKLLGSVRREFRFLISDYTYGYLREYCIAKHSIKYLQNLQDHILRTTTSGKAIFTSIRDNSMKNGMIMPGMSSMISKHTSFVPTRSHLSIPSTSLPAVGSVHQRSRIVGLYDAPQEPRFGAWLKAGDDVEGTEFEDKTGEAHWYKGKLTKVSSNGDYFIDYDDESFGVVSNRLVRAFQPYYVGEELDVLLFSDEGESIEYCTIVAANEDGTFDVFVEDLELLVENVFTSEFRRPNFDAPLDEEEEEIVNRYA